MQYEISNRMSDVHGSAIRELFKLGTDPNMISFGGGNPSAETFPVPEIADIIADVMKNAPVSVLQYGLSEGYTPLRDTMKDIIFDALAALAVSAAGFFAIRKQKAGRADAA